MERNILCRELELTVVNNDPTGTNYESENGFTPSNVSTPVRSGEDVSPGYTAYATISLAIPANPCFAGYFRKDEKGKIKEFICTGKFRGTVQQETALFAPSHLDLSAPVDIIIYLHGHLTAHPGAGKSHSPSIREYLNYKKQPYFTLRETMEVSRSNAILVAPTLGPRSQFGNLAARFDQYMDSVIEAIKAYILPRYNKANQFTTGKLILAAHSGGGLPLLTILQSKNSYAKKVDEVWGFDSWYNSSVAWKKIAAANPKMQITGYYYNSGNLPVLVPPRQKRKKINNFMSVRVASDKPGLDHFTLVPYYLAEKLKNQSPKTENEWEFREKGDYFSDSNYALFDQEIQSGIAFEQETADPTKESSPFHYTKFQKDRSDSRFFDFKKRVYQAHLNWAASGGKTFVADQPSSELTDWNYTDYLTFSVKKKKKIYKRVTVHRRMADSLKQLMDAAKAAAEKAGKMMNAYVSNGYRSASTQFNAWDSNFKKYYDRAVKEAGLKPGDYSNDAVSTLTVFIRAKLGAPGYSNHQHGRAVDFFLLEWSDLKKKKLAYEVSTQSANVKNWRTTWFWKWLTENAAEYGFCPYDKEPWHWEYWKDIDPTMARCKKKDSNQSSPKKKVAPIGKAISPEAIAPTPNHSNTCNTKAVVKAGKGYKAYGGGRLDTKLKALRAAGKLTLSDNDILLLQELARTESGGLVQAINSWDSAYMSMGFAQFTFIHKHHFPYKKIRQIANSSDLQQLAGKCPEAFKAYFDKKEEPGKLQMIVERAPAAFAKYGIELEGTIKWKDRKKKTHEVKSLKGLTSLSDLRKLEWARRFYCAGLNEDIIIAQAKLTLYVLEMSLYTMQIKIGSDYFLHYYKSSDKLRGLIQEAYNNRPAYLTEALKETSHKLSPKGKVSVQEFLDTLKPAIVKQYEAKENDKAKGERLTKKY